jgi:hypothetical protein
MKLFNDLIRLPHKQEQKNGSRDDIIKEKEPAEESVNEFLDEKALLKQSKFPIKPDALIARTKEVLVALKDIDNPSVEKLFSDDFVMCAPFVGGATNATPEDKKPGIPKDKMLAALRGFKLMEAFPDTNNNYHAFRVDPFETNRVWFQTRAFATHTDTLMGHAATGKRLELPPQAYSMTFNEGGQVTFFNIGYVLDRTVGNTGGLGGAFGFLYGVGHPLPVPECQPYKPSWQFATLNWMRSAMEKMGYA